MHLLEWWLSEAMYYILPNRLYWMLGANEIDSDGEEEWYILVRATFSYKAPLALTPDES